MYNESTKKAVAKYNNKTYDQLKINVKKGKRDEYKLHAQSQGKSLTELIIELLEYDIKFLKDYIKAGD